MKKSLFLLLIGGFALASCAKDSTKIVDNTGKYKGYESDTYQMKDLEDEKITVTFYYNFGKEEINLNSGMYASGTTTALKIDEIDKGEKATKPDTDPLRLNYEFAGWHTHESEESPFDFNTILNNSTLLYAHWLKVQEDEFVEPDYVEPSHIDDSIDNLVQVNGVLNMFVSGSNVTVANASLSRLKRTPSNVVDCLNYKMKTGVTLSASFNVSTNTISYTATKGGENQNGSITVSTSDFNGPNGTYNTKAKNYEERDIAIEDHRIMLAGSSSMENWKNSSADLQPLTTYNHGIGGTTVGEWKDSYNARLVYPYSPKMVAYYVGVNDLKDKSPSQTSVAEAIGTNLQLMFDDVHAHLPNTQIFYVLINKLPGFLKQQPLFEICNNMALQYAETHSYVTCINAGTGLLKENGDPNQAFFLMDGIHMSLAGYSIWGKVVKDTLISYLKEQNA